MAQSSRVRKWPRISLKGRAVVNCHSVTEQNVSRQVEVDSEDGHSAASLSTDMPRAVNCG